VLRDLVNATVGFEALAAETAKPAKSLHRMLSKDGNPTMDNLAAILGVVRRKLGVEIRVQAVAAGSTVAIAGDPEGTLVASLTQVASDS
jgi:DNA-binding phage protein